MSKHTPEPWKLGDTNVHGVQVLGPVDEDGELTVIAEGMTRENAHRVVACVNACAGIPTEALKAGSVRELVEALNRTTLGAPEDYEAVLDKSTLSPEELQRRIQAARDFMAKVKP